jgi:hypothetical protein
MWTGDKDFMKKPWPGNKQLFRRGRPAAALNIIISLRARYFNKQ